MQKIPTLFERDPEDRRYVLDSCTPGAEWVLAGEGRATRKWDGTCTMLDIYGDWWARREVKPGKDVPPNFISLHYDEITLKETGWEPIAQSSFAKFHAGAAELIGPCTWRPGTYELVGPKINGNPDRVVCHTLIRHGWMNEEDRKDFPQAPRTYHGLADWLYDRPGVEGIVFHHPDGRMVKIKRRDFRYEN